MVFLRKMIICGILALVTLMAPPAQAEELQAAYHAKIGWTLHLLETGRYGEAEDSSQTLIEAYPNAALPYELRGASALYVGSVSQAQKDFSHAAETSRDAETLYGQSLCALFQGKIEAAATLLSQATALPDLTESQSDDLATAQAYVKFLRGDLAGEQSVIGQASSRNDGLQVEISALALNRSDPKSGIDKLEKFLVTPSGVPRLREEDGLRPLFDSKTPLEPCVIEPELQQMYADRLKGNMIDTAHRDSSVATFSGVTALTPTETIPARAALVSFSVDGQMAAMVSQSPYQFSWNTIAVANGIHQIRIDSIDAAGNALSTQTLTVRVSNRNGLTTSQNADDPEMIALRARLWNLLRLRPSRKVAEWSLAQSLLATGDRISAAAHLANAAALDPAYKNGQKFARNLFGAASSAYWIGNIRRREIALTFDDGPNLLKTPALLDALEDAKAPATFFVVGSRAELAPEIIRRMTTDGYEVENHSYTHPNMNLVIPTVAEGEILKTSVLINALTGHQPHFFRPPGGNANSMVEQLAHGYGLSLAYWTVDALHAEDVGSATELVSYVLSRVRPGSIVLMHNGPDVTTAAIPELVKALRAKGYTLVTLSRVVQGISTTKHTAMPKMHE